MTSPLLEYRTVDLHSGGMRLQLTSGYAEPVAVRGKDTIVPGHAGRYVRNRVADLRTLRLDGYIATATAEEWRTTTDLLAQIIDTRLDPGDLIFRAPYLGLGAGQSATISARVVNAVGGPILAMLYQRWSIELESVDPDWVVA